MISALATLGSRHRVVVCAVLLILGIAVSRQMPSAHYAVAAALPFAGLAVAGFRRFLFVIFFPIGIALPFFELQTPDPGLSEAINKKSVVTGWLYENARKRPGSVKISVNVDSVSRPGKTVRTDGKMLIYSNGLETLSYGDTVQARLTIKPVRAFKNPGSGNYTERLAAKGVFFTAYSEADKIKTGSVHKDANAVLRLINKLRRDYAVFVRGNLAPVEAEIVNSLSIGEKGAIPDELKRKFSTLGIGHLFAISGLHVGMAAVFFYMTIKWILKRSEYLLVIFIVPKIAAAATIPAVFLYSLLTGFANSSVRAAIMASVYLVAIMAGRRDDRLNSLAVAAIIILFATPGALFEASFILSFSAVLGILLALNCFSPAGNSADEMPRGGKTFARNVRAAVSAIVFTTAAATMATLPFVVNMFGFLPVLTFPANMAAMPLALAMVPLCILSLAVFAAFGFVPQFLIDILSLLASLLAGTAETLSSISPAVAVPALGKQTFFLFYLFSASVLLARRSRKILFLVPALAACVAGSVAFDIRPAGGAQAEASFFDAGRKNIALFTFRNGKTVLVKGGFSKKARSDFIDKAVVSPALLRKRITKTDFIILLSNDGSQLNGTVALIERNGVENLWINGPKLNGKLWNAVENNGVLWKNIHYAPPVLNIGENGEAQVKFLKLWEKSGIADSTVPRPMLVKVVCGKTSFLLMESIQNTYRKNVGNIYKDKIGSDVVFLPEINKKNRDAIVSVVKSAQPRIVVCRNCKSGLNEAGLFPEIRETGTEGMVSVFTDGEKITRTEGFRTSR